MFVARHRGIDGAICLAHQWPVILVRTFRAGCGGHAEAKRSVPLSADVVDQDAAAVVNQFRRPETPRGPSRWIGEDDAGGRPVMKIARSIQRKIRRPVAGSARCPVSVPDADDGGVGMVAGNDRIARYGLSAQRTISENSGHPNHKKTKCHDARKMFPGIAAEEHRMPFFEVKGASDGG